MKHSEIWSIPSIDMALARALKGYDQKVPDETVEGFINDNPLRIANITKPPWAAEILPSGKINCSEGLQVRFRNRASSLSKWKVLERSPKTAVFGDFSYKLPFSASRTVTLELA